MRPNSIIPLNFHLVLPAQVGLGDMCVCVHVPMFKGWGFLLLKLRLKGGDLGGWEGGNISFLCLSFEIPFKLSLPVMEAC